MKLFACMSVKFSCYEHEKSKRKRHKPNNTLYDDTHSVIVLDDP